MMLKRPPRFTVLRLSVASRKLKKAEKRFKEAARGFPASQLHLHPGIRGLKREVRALKAKKEFLEFVRSAEEGLRNGSLTREDFLKRVGREQENFKAWTAKLGR